MNKVSRREFVRGLAVAAPALAFPDVVLAGVRLKTDTALAAAGTSTAAGAILAPTRALTFLHTHTGERLTTEYFTRGAYVSDALAAINHHLRDFRTGEVHEIDPDLLDLLHRLTAATGTNKPFQVISGYRSPKTNQMLRSKSTGVAAGSLHMVGKAIDIRLADVPLPKLRTAAQSLRCGGVGYYPGPDFVHVDTGRVRQW